jgi:hypothetical protein
MTHSSASMLDAPAGVTALSGGSVGFNGFLIGPD